MISDLHMAQLENLGRFTIHQTNQRDKYRNLRLDSATHVAVATHGTIRVQQSLAVWKSIVVPAASPPQFRPCAWLELSDIQDWTLSSCKLRFCA